MTHSPPPQDSDDIQDILELNTPGGAGRWLRRAIWALLVLLALGGVGWLLVRDGRAERDNAYVTEPVRRGGLVVTVIATGSIQPTNQVDVSSELSGMIRKVLVDYNSTVTEGQVLAELDTDKLKATVQHSRAALSAVRAGAVEAKATVVEKQAEYRRKQHLAADRFTSQQDLEAARAGYERAEAGLSSAQAQVEVAEAQLKIDETNLYKAAIRSPIGGVVLQRNASIGQTVASSFQAPILFSIAEDLRQMELQVDIDEADIGKVVDGQGASFTVDAYPDRSFPATIRQLRYASQTSSGVVTYKAVLTIDNAQMLLRPGMTATAEIVVQRVEQARLVPNAALRFTPSAEDEPAKRESFLQSLLPRPPSFRPPSPQDDAHAPRRVWVVRDGVPEAVAVRVGASDGLNTELLSEAPAEGQAVIVDRRATRK